MAFPAIRSETSAAQTTSGTSHSILLPATISAGDRLLVFVSLQNSATGTSSFTFPGGWTELVDNYKAQFLTYALAWKVADGTEDGTSITVTSEKSEKVTHKSWSFSGAGNLYAGYEAITYATNANPPSLAPGVGAKDFLWLALAALQGDIVVSGYPTSYTGTGYFNPGVVWVDDVTIAWATRELNAASEDPAVFTSTLTERSGITVGIEPTAAVPTITSVEPTTIKPGSTLTINTTGFTLAPDTITYRGISETFTGTPTTTQSVMTAIPLTDFGPSPAHHSATRWQTNYTLTVSKGGESANFTVQVDPSVTTSEDFTQTSGASDVDNFNPVTGAVGGDDFFAYWHTGDGVRDETILGTAEAGSGYMAPITVPSQGRRMAYDVSGLVWLTPVDTDYFTEPLNPAESGFLLTAVRSAANRIVKKVVRVIK